MAYCPKCKSEIPMMALLCSNCGEDFRCETFSKGKWYKDVVYIEPELKYRKTSASTPK